MRAELRRDQNQKRAEQPSREDEAIEPAGNGAGKGVMEPEKQTMEALFGQ
jgi:hypothetical protein